MQPILVISDSLGDSAASIVEAAATQFELDEMVIERLPNATAIDPIMAFIEHSQQKYPNTALIAFFTFTNPDLSIQTKQLLGELGIEYVDVLGPAMNALASVSGQMPLSQPGLIHKTDEDYYKRIEAIEFAVSHDDGRNTQDLVKSDIVVIGSSRTSKTPLSIYLATQGYKVANVPLALGTEPPKELYDVEISRLFGLTSKPELLARIRKQRLGNAQIVAGDYASLDYVKKDLEEARYYMRTLGCIVIRTDNRAIEEAAAEIVRYYSAVHSIDNMAGR
ncbi:MAG: kinase/pyrophosphorylase [Coriobacteriia bacterium]|nr:kinase/pyrophosphorylase [Coriobacteriia bacterium]MCL2750007.1 kinase/pyrophosphorylase [Coriobacteriia bacterium]